MYEVVGFQVERIGDVITLGQHLKVVCIGRDMRGNLKLSRKAAMTPEEESATVTGQSSGISKVSTGLLERSASLGDQIRSSGQSVSDGVLKQTLDSRIKTKTGVEEAVVTSASSISFDASRGTVEVAEEGSIRMFTGSSAAPPSQSQSSSPTRSENSKGRRVSTSSSSDPASDERPSSPKRPRKQSVRRKGKSNETSQNLGFEVQNRGE